MAKNDEKIIASEKKIKITEIELLSAVADKLGVSISDVSDIWNGIKQQIISECSDGKTIMITGFGSFCIKRHKGHPIQFDSGTSAVSDYPVFKFSTSDILGKRLRQAYIDGHIKTVND